MIKKSYSVQMSYNVTDHEKHEAERAIMFFNHAVKLLRTASDHLNIMKTPFKDNANMNPEEIMQARAAIRRFRDKAIENFNTFKKASFECIRVLQNFSSDTQTIKLMKSFIGAVDQLETKVNDFADLFNDLEAKDFPQKVVSSIENIQSECEDLEDIMDARIKNHIQTNILATNWVDNVSNNLNEAIEEKTPLMLDLFNKRQDQLNDMIQERTQLGT